MAEALADALRGAGYDPEGAADHAAAVERVAGNVGQLIPSDVLDMYRGYSRREWENMSLADFRDGVDLPPPRHPAEHQRSARSR